MRLVNGRTPEAQVSGGVIRHLIKMLYPKLGNWPLTDTDKNSNMIDSVYIINSPERLIDFY